MDEYALDMDWLGEDDGDPFFEDEDNFEVLDEDYGDPYGDEYADAWLDDAWADHWDDDPSPYAGTYSEE